MKFYFNGQKEIIELQFDGRKFRWCDFSRLKKGKKNASHNDQFFKYLPRELKGRIEAERFFQLSKIDRERKVKEAAEDEAKRWEHFQNFGFFPKF